MRSKRGETPQEVARATVLFNLSAMSRQNGWSAVEETPSFQLEVRKHYAKINNALAEKWGLWENVIEVEKIA